MGKLNVVILRYLSRDDFRVLTAVSCFITIFIYTVVCNVVCSTQQNTIYTLNPVEMLLFQQCNMYCQ